MLKFSASWLSVAALAVMLSSASRADWLQYRGPTQNGATGEQSWNPAKAATPKVLWKAQLGKGTSAVTVSGGRAFTMGNVNGTDVIYCLEAASGKVLWRQEYPMSVDPKYFEGGTRSTPVLDGNRLFAVSHEGDLWCLDTASGKKLWYKHYQQDFGGRRPDWGYAGSPLVKGGLLFCDVGAPSASTVALDKTSGQVVWKSGSDQGAYATPVAANLGGKETLVVFKTDAVVGCALESGEELWRTPWKTSYDVNAATPLAVGGNRLFVTSGYNTGCALFQVRDRTLTQLWRNKNLRGQISTPAQLGENLYGIDGDVGGGNLVCLSLADGNRRWQEKSVRGGSLIQSNGKLIVLSERGELVICDASPEGFHPLARAQVLAKRCWTQPTLDAGRLFLRNNEGDMVCLDMKP